MKSRKTIELEVDDLQAQLDEMSKAKQDVSSNGKSAIQKLPAVSAV